MRIISGIHKGRKFHPPRKNPARPTTDFAKEGLFNILHNVWNFEQVKYLDLFGGTGSISFEMGSRGCPDITLVELHGPNIQFIEQTAEQLDLPIQAIQMDVFAFMAATPHKYDIIFAGPPYPLPNLGEIPNLLFEHELLLPGGWFILEHNPQYNFEDHPKLHMMRTYGTTHFSIFMEPEEETTS